jgi:hypothetical protein
MVKTSPATFDARSSRSRQAVDNEKLLLPLLEHYSMRQLSEAGITSGVIDANKARPCRFVQHSRYKMTFEPGP